MKNRLLLLAAIILGVIGTLVIGCGGSGSKTVAQVGNYDISVNELEDFFQGGRFPFTSADDEFEKRREILDSMIVNRLLILAAYENNIDQLEEVNRIVVANRDKFLLDVLYQKMVIQKSEVSDAEIRAHYDMIENKVRASHILVENLDTAKALLARISEGENFEKLAFEYSKDPSAQRNKGDLGYFLWGSMVNEFQEAAYAMEPGEVSPPVKTRFGYHIIKLVDKQPNDLRLDFETMKSELKLQIGNKKRSDLMNEYYDDIKERYPITIDTTTCNYLLKKREFLYPEQMLASLPKNDFDPEQLDRNEKELILATWDGGQMSIVEYLEQAKQMPPAMKPDFDNYDSLTTIVFQLKRLDILTYEAVRKGIDKDDEFVRKIKLFKEIAMADIMLNDSLPKPLPPDEGMIRLYYDDNSEEFVNPAKIHVYEILLSDELKAKKYAKEIKNLEKFKSIAMDLTERPGKRPVQGNLDYIERRWFPEIFDLAKKTKNRTVGGPVVTQGKYSIFYVVDKLEEEMKDFLSVKNVISDLIVKKQEVETLHKWIEDRKANTNIEVYDDVIWSTIDKSKYAAVETSSDGNN